MNAHHSGGIPLNCFALRPVKILPNRHQIVDAFNVLINGVMHRIYPGTGRAVTLDELAGKVWAVGDNLGLGGVEKIDIVDASGNFAMVTLQELVAHPVVTRLNGQSRKRILDHLQRQSERGQA